MPVSAAAHLKASRRAAASKACRSAAAARKSHSGSWSKSIRVPSSNVRQTEVALTEDRSASPSDKDVTVRRLLMSRIARQSGAQLRALDDQPDFRIEVQRALIRVIEPTNTAGDRTRTPGVQCVLPQSSAISIACPDDRRAKDRSDLVQVDALFERRRLVCLVANERSACRSMRADSEYPHADVALAQALERISSRRVPARR